jgi:hypothetical protein
LKKITVVNIYNFIRRSNEEPGCFIQDDFDTIKNQIEILKQYELPSTFALKHDALIDPQYQKLILDNIDSYDEVAVWWEITAELCKRAGIAYQGEESEVFDNRVSCGYSIGYTHEQRKALVDAYMKDFKDVFGYYPKTIASWVIDIITLEYAYEKYGVVGGALCRDQIGTDGFTLWGGYINGAFYPSKYNEIMPAQSLENQVNMPLFRLLGPDPIYNFESDLREGVRGVYSLEPVWPTGRDDKWIPWIFNCITEEDTIGMNYAQVGQENNFLWENIKPGFEPQLKHIKELAENGKLRIETLAETAEWFKQKYKTTPPATYQSSQDWNEEFDLKTTWYSCKNYRISFLYEQDKLSIRDLFVYNENYKSHYYEHLMVGNESIFDALPIMNPHYWSDDSNRASVAIVDSNQNPITGKEVIFSSEGDTCSKVTLKADSDIIFTMSEDRITINGDIGLWINKLPVLKEVLDNQLIMTHNSFEYKISVLTGTISKVNDGVLIQSFNNEIVLLLNQNAFVKEIYTDTYLQNSDKIDCYIPNYQTQTSTRTKKAKLAAPHIIPTDIVCVKGTVQTVMIENSNDTGCIYYTLDGTEPTKNSFQYDKPITVTENTTIQAKVFTTNDQPDSNSTSSTIFFTEKIVDIQSNTVFDTRKSFKHNGINELLNTQRGSLDYQDGNWFATLEDLDFTATLENSTLISKVTVGFLSNHRSGVIYPESISLYAGNTPDELTFIETINIPNCQTNREVEKTDIVFHTKCNAKYIRIFAKNYIIQPSWCCYRGLPGAFMLSDSIIIE